MIAPRRNVQFGNELPDGAEYGLSCGHVVRSHVVLTVDGAWLLPDSLSCSQCPQVPAAREFTYLKGERVVALRRVA